MMDDVSNTAFDTSYHAPEMRLRGAATDRPHYSLPADIWSFGAMGYRLCTKDKFLDGLAMNESTISDQLNKITHPAVKDFLQKCLRINPRERSTASDLLLHILLTEGKLIK